ncbi:hypothetical protein [uncultured Ruminococcus sp.]|uniref:hypothetical protein n=1 Tax=uncultured Ruminococcus sp. TaxID=165186 RepID=UPI0025EAC32A|nr:hypothetical protein [uncultured Ruminococcus sp.]
MKQETNMKEYRVVKAVHDKGYRAATQIMRDMSVRGWEAVNIREKSGSVLITFKRDI